MKKKIKGLFVICIIIVSSFFIIPSTNADSKTDDIIEMINQVDKSLIYNYHKNLMAYGPRYTESDNCFLAGMYLYNSF